MDDFNRKQAEDAALYQSLKEAKLAQQKLEEEKLKRENESKEKIKAAQACT